MCPNSRECTLEGRAGAGHFLVASPLWASVSPLWSNGLVSETVLVLWLTTQAQGVGDGGGGDLLLWGAEVRVEMTRGCFKGEC